MHFWYDLQTSTRTVDSSRKDNDGLHGSSSGRMIFTIRTQLLDSGLLWSRSMLQLVGNRHQVNTLCGITGVTVGADQQRRLH